MRIAVAQLIPSQLPISVNPGLASSRNLIILIRLSRLSLRVVDGIDFEFFLFVMLDGSGFGFLFGIILYPAT